MSEFKPETIEGVKNAWNYRGYMVCSDGTFSMKVIRPLGKGSVPLELRNKYTTNAFAFDAIDMYLVEQENGKAKKSGGGKELG